MSPPRRSVKARAELFTNARLAELLAREAEKVKQGVEIETVNRELESANVKLRVLRSVELNLDPAGEGYLEENAIAKLVLCRPRQIQSVLAPINLLAKESHG